MFDIILQKALYSALVSAAWCLPSGSGPVHVFPQICIGCAYNAILTLSNLFESTSTSGLS